MNVIINMKMRNENSSFTVNLTDNRPMNESCANCRLCFNNKCLLYGWTVDLFFQKKCKFWRKRDYSIKLTSKYH